MQKTNMQIKELLTNGTTSQTTNRN